jgi:antirestriction protein ArdC
MRGELFITQDTRPDHAQYLAHWLRLLKADKRALFLPPRRPSKPLPISNPFSARAEFDLAKPRPEPAL